MSQTLVYTWHKRFMDCWSGEPVEESRGRPTKRNNKNQVTDVTHEHRRLTVCEVGVTDMLEIGKSSVQRILSDLSMTNLKVCARLVPRLLNEDQMKSRAFASKEFLKIQRKVNYF